jgi:hypothetical protein
MISNLRSQEEGQSQQYIYENLKPYYLLFDDILQIFDITIRVIGQYPRYSPSSKVGFILLTRLENEIRVCTILSQMGYGLQALVNASSVMEIVGALSYIGINDKRAEHWAMHMDKKHSFPNAFEGITAILNQLEIINPKAINNWHKAYEFMCMSKHINPILAMNYGLRQISNGIYSSPRGPDSSKIGILLSAETMYMIIKISLVGITLVTDHCRRNILNEIILANVNKIGLRVNELEDWFENIINENQ